MTPDLSEFQGALFERFVIAPQLSMVIYKNVMILGWQIDPKDVGLFENLNVEIFEEQVSSVGSRLFDLACRSLRTIRGTGLPDDLKIRCMWTSRTMVLSEGSKNIEASFVRNFVKHTETSDVGFEKIIEKFHEKKFHAGWGNNLLLSDSQQLTESYFGIYCELQYLYVQAHLINEGLSSILSRMRHSDLRAADLRDLKEFEYEFFYISFGLSELQHLTQGMQRSVLLDFMQVWQFEQFYADVDRKINRLRQFVTGRLGERYGIIQRNIRTMLYLIGSIEIIGAFVSIIDLADSDRSGGFLKFGVLGLIRQINPDILVTGSFLLFAGLAVVVLSLGISGDKD